MRAASRLNCRPPRGWFSFERALLNSCGRGPEDLFKTPAFVSAEGAALDNSNHVALMRFPVLVVRHELRALRHDSLVNRMRHTPAHFDHDGLLHLRARHDANFFLAMPDFFFFCCRRCFVSHYFSHA